MAKNGWKLTVLEVFNHTCQICGSHSNLTVHHKKPLGRGGGSTADNVVCWCRDCHRAYHNKWGVTISDNFGNPVEHRYEHRNSPKRKHHKKNRR